MARNSATVRGTVFGNGLVCIINYFNTLCKAMVESSAQIALFDIEYNFNYVMGVQYVYVVRIARNYMT